MIIIFGGSGTLGNAIVKNLIDRTPLIIVVNKSYAQTKKKYSKFKKIKIFKVNLENPNELINFLEVDLKKYLSNIKGIIINSAKTILEQNLKYSNNVEGLFRVNYATSANIFSFFSKLDNNYLPIRVVTILSNSLKTLNASNIHYISSKSALNTLGNIYAKKFASKMIINSINPGLMRSPFTKDRFDKVKNNIIKNTPIKRLSTPNEISEVIKYFSLDVPKSVTGQSIFVDGGRTI